MCAGEKFVETKNNRRILVVESDDDVAREWRSILAQNGYQADSVTAIPDALERVSAGGCDMVILDMDVAASKGMPILESFRKESAGPSLPIIIAVNINLRPILVKAIDVNFDDYLIKPVDGIELLSRVTSVFRKYDLECELARRSEELQKARQDLKQKESHLIQSAKLAAIGTLAASVAHELNQPLAVIRGTTQMMLLEKHHNESCNTDLETVLLQSGKMSKIIDHLMDFSRRGQDERTVVDINRTVHDALAFVHQQLAKRGIAVIFELADKLTGVMANRTQIEQVFLNLILNARDALDGKQSPTLRVRTRLMSRPEDIREAHAKAPKQIRTPINRRGYVVIDFIDNGCGISPEHISRIFEPFFTTKPAGRGTGLGLSVSANIVRDHAGWISVESNPQAGASFSIFLPVAPRWHR